MLFCMCLYKKYPPTARAIASTATPTPIPAFAPEPRPDECADGGVVGAADVAGVVGVLGELDVLDAVDLELALLVVVVVVAGSDVAVDEELVVVKNPEPMFPPMVVMLANAPKKKTSLSFKQQSLSEPAQQ